MGDFKVRVKFLRLCLSGVVVFGSVVSWSEWTGAIEARSNSETIQFNPPDRQPPPTAVGGAVRCGSKVELSALVVTIPDEDYIFSYFGLTTADRPVFYFYNRDRTRQEQVFFMLMEGDAEHPPRESTTIYETTFDIPEGVGIISFNLPPDVTLKEGKIYQWYIEDSSEVSVEWLYGWIERIETPPELADRLAEAETEIERAKTYAEAGIWYDALETLMQERQVADTPDVQAKWESLLKYLGWSERTFNELVEASVWELEARSENPVN